MNKKSILLILLDLVFLIVFNVIFFVVGGTDHKLSVWISYIFIHFAYLMILITPLLLKKSVKNTSLGLSLYSISAVYFFITFIIGIFFILLHLDNYKSGLVIHVIIAGIYAIILISNMIANEYTVENIEKHETEIKYVKECSARLKGILDRTEDRKMKKKIEQVYDLIHSSQVKSEVHVRDYEIQVINLIEALDEKTQENNTDMVNELLKEITNIANKRNNALKYR